jgi:hypothetical protein
MERRCGAVSIGSALLFCKASQLASSSLARRVIHVKFHSANHHRREGRLRTVLYRTFTISKIALYFQIFTFQVHHVAIG